MALKTITMQGFTILSIIVTEKLIVTKVEERALLHLDLLGTFSVRNNCQESESIQQIPDNFYGINLIFS